VEEEAMRRSILSALLASAALCFAPAPIAFAQVTRVPPILRSPSQVMPPVRACQPSVRDCDGDAHNSHAHGGGDCDDNDRTRYPGNPEVADTNGHDEDCDTLTFGQVDADHDGEFDARYFNTTASGEREGGTDCDDTRRGIRSTAQELPNRIDDDCNGRVDDLLGEWYTPPR
jgi:hypothetical protein